MKLSYLFQISFAVLFVCLCEEAFSAKIIGNYSRSATRRGLYTEEDRIVQLNAYNFQNTIYGSNNAWLVEFYASWCVHCINFAPRWKTLAADLYEWNNYIQLAAIDCADYVNYFTCRHYNIWAVPALRYFSPHSKPYSLGKVVSKFPSPKDCINCKDSNGQWIEPNVRQHLEQCYG